MGAFNDLLIENRCPECEQHTRIRCQIHVAADFDGDERGRFALNEYRLGQRLWWWPPDDRRFATWREDADRENADGSVDEHTYARCEICGTDLCVGIRFRDVTAIEVLSIAVEGPQGCG
jgi:hypothetical protein